MAMYLTCRACRKRLSVPDSAAGKRTKCPACGAPNDIPGTPWQPDIVSLAQEKSPTLPAKECPACQSQLPRDAAICVHCGLDLRKGKKLRRGSMSPANANTAHQQRTPGKALEPSPM